jgi:hypothetical protein
MVVYSCLVKSGPEFALSREKRAFDLLVAKSLYPVYGIGKLAVVTSPVNLSSCKSGQEEAASLLC